MEQKTTLSRNITVAGLVATGISSMIGASIYIVPFMLQKNIPGIGPYLLPAFFVASIPAVFAALTYAILEVVMYMPVGQFILTGGL
jgi:APA family basic amino acid/polyamine antiporter